MKKWIGIILLSLLFSGIKAQTNGLEYAKGLFVEGDFVASGKKLQDYLQSVDSKDAEVYALAVLSFVQNNAGEKAAQIIHLSAQRGLDINDVFRQMRQISISSGMPGIFEKISVLLKLKENTCTEISGKYLLQFYLDNRNYEKAKPMLDELLRINPVSIEYHSTLALVYQSQGRDSLAVETYKKVLELDPLHFDANVFIGTFYFLKGKRELEKLLNQYTDAGSITRIDDIRYKALRKEIITQYISLSVIYMENANLTRSTSLIREIIQSEQDWLNELVPKDALVKEKNRLKIILKQ